MKKVFFILGGIILLAIVNIVPLHKFIANVKGHSLYKEGQYAVSAEVFGNIENNYNEANSYFELGQYQEAINIYENISDKNHAIYHNIGSAYYFSALEENTSLSARLSLLKKSLSNFKKAEVIQADEETTINKEIVEAEIKKLEEALKKAEEEEQKQQEQQENTEQDQNSEQENNLGTEPETEAEDAENTQGSDEQQENTEENEDAENSEGSGTEQSEEETGDDTSEQSGTSGEGENDGQEGESGQQSESGLNQEQADAIENYSRNLENSQQEYAEYYNKTYNESRSGFNSLFGNDPFFDNSLLEDGTQKKDW